MNPSFFITDPHGVELLIEIGPDGPSVGISGGDSVVLDLDALRRLQEFLEDATQPAE